MQWVPCDIIDPFILQDSLTSHFCAGLALIRSRCYLPPDNRWRRRGQTNPQRGHACACGPLVLLQLITCLCFSPVFENTMLRTYLLKVAGDDVDLLARWHHLVGIDHTKQLAHMVVFAAVQDLREFIEQPVKDLVPRQATERESIWGDG